MRSCSVWSPPRRPRSTRKTRWRGRRSKKSSGKSALARRMAAWRKLPQKLLAYRPPHSSVFVIGLGIGLAVGLSIGIGLTWLDGRRAPEPVRAQVAEITPPAPEAEPAAPVVPPAYIEQTEPAPPEEDEAPVTEPMPPAVVDNQPLPQSAEPLPAPQPSPVPSFCAGATAGGARPRCCRDSGAGMAEECGGLDRSRQPADDRHRAGRCRRDARRCGGGTRPAGAGDAVDHDLCAQCGEDRAGRPQRRPRDHGPCADGADQPRCRSGEKRAAGQSQPGGDRAAPGLGASRSSRAMSASTTIWAASSPRTPPACAWCCRR